VTAYRSLCKSGCFDAYNTQVPLLFRTQRSVVLHCRLGTTPPVPCSRSSLTGLMLAPDSILAQSTYVPQCARARTLSVARRHSFVLPFCMGQLLVHRRLLYDDNFGVDEALNEPGLSWDGAGIVVRGIHRIALTPTADAPAAQKGLQQQVMFPPRLAVSALSVSPSGESVSLGDEVATRKCHNDHTHSYVQSRLSTACSSVDRKLQWLIFWSNCWRVTRECPSRNSARMGVWICPLAPGPFV
jgi:hypothetical protein